MITEHVCGRSMQICGTAFTRAMASKRCRLCLRTVAEVHCTSLFSRASPDDNLAERLSALLQVTRGYDRAGMQRTRHGLPQLPRWGWRRC